MTVGSTSLFPDLLAISLLKQLHQYLRSTLTIRQHRAEVRFIMLLTHN
ncbi:MAG: hypothetical protein QGG54_20530 [Gammaproteobacteria bacterium]|nr:hypothetical protein [Gammaproteobacteria bacterium]